LDNWLQKYGYSKFFGEIRTVVGQSTVFIIQITDVMYSTRCNREIVRYFAGSE